MATITTDTFLDDGTARTAGETWTLTGAILTIRTDTRWHVGKPAGMTGSIGATSTNATRGGGVLIDGRNVRELWFNSGSGNVPAIGTLITQGSASGYLLGVWPDLASAPITPGSAMPASGMIKFREVTGGTFFAGALTGISATSLGAEYPSWIEVVQRQAVANTVTRLGSFRTRGNWYTLPQLTSGSAGQIIQTPTNGGGAGTNVPAVWIETGPSTNVYEAWPTVISSGFIPANFGTDARSKIAENMGNGQVRLGNNGTNDVGMLPPAGCRIRIPNVIGRQSIAADDSINQIPNSTLATRPDFVVNQNGVVDFDFFMNDWYHLFQTPNNVYVKNSATFDIHSTSNEAQATILENFVIGAYSGNQVALNLTTNPYGGSIKNCKFLRYGASASGNACSIVSCSNYTFENCHFGVLQYARNTGHAVNISLSTDLKFKDTFLYAGAFYTATCLNLELIDTDYTDRIVGNTNITTGKNAFNFTSLSDGVLVDGITFGLKGTLPLGVFVNPYFSLFLIASCNNVTIRNAGTLANPLLCENATFATPYILQDSGINKNLIAKRLYLNICRSGTFTCTNTSNNVVIENVSSNAGTLQLLALNNIAKGVRGAGVSTSGSSAIYGSIFLDMFTSDLLGLVSMAMNEPTPETAAQISYTLNNGGGFTSTGAFVMPTINDVITVTMPYFAKGHTSFRNSAPLINGATGNYLFQYDLDTGAGFTGTFKTLTAANLITEVIDPVVGFRLRFRATTTVTSPVTSITLVQVLTNSTLSAQENNLYVLETANVSLTGMTPNSRVQLYDTTNDQELFNDVVPSGTLNFSAPFLGNINLRTRIAYATPSTANEFIELYDTLTSAGVSRSIAPEIDSIYVSNNVDGSSVTGIVIDDAAMRVEINTGVISWPQIYAYEVYWLQTLQGIRDEGKFIRAIDGANYIVDSFKIKNVSSPTAPLSIVDGWGRDSVTNETSTIMDNTGGSIFSNPDLVISYATGSGLSPVQDETLNKLNVLTEDVSGLRFTSKALEEAPSGGGGGGGETKEDIYTYFTTGSRQDTFKATGFATPTNVTNAQTAIIAEVNANEAKIDIVDTVVDAIKLKTDLIPADPATNTVVNTRLASGSYVAPDNANIALIKAKTDTLVNTDLSGVATTTQLESTEETLLEAIGTGGVTPAEVYDYFTAGNREDVFKADVSGLATSEELGEIEIDLTPIQEAIDELPTLPQIRADLERPDGKIQLTLDAVEQIDMSGVTRNETLFGEVLFPQEITGVVMPNETLTGTVQE